MVTINRHFDTLDALADYCERAPAATWKSSRTSPGEMSWDFGAGFDGALRLARYGWPEGAEQAKRMLDTMPRFDMTELAPDTYLDVDGEYPDIDACLRGQPECMVAFREDSRAATVARIVASGSIYSEIPADQVMARGVCIAAIVDTLETQGIRCEVIWKKLHRGTSEYAATVTLKEAHEALNLDRLAFGLAHPAMNRRLNFSVQEQEPYEVQRDCLLTYHGGYGRKLQMPEEPGVITFQQMWEVGEWTMHTAAAKVRAKLEQFTAAHTH